MMEFTNHFTTSSERPRATMEKFVLLLSPFAPHMAEELWQALGHKESLAYEPWPEFDSTLAKEDSVEVPVQINGKVRLKLKVPAGISDAELESKARSDAVEWWTRTNLKQAEFELKKLVSGRMV